MRSLKKVTAICAILLSCSCFAEEAIQAASVTPIQEIKSTTLDFDQLPTESVVGSLAEHVIGNESLVDGFASRIKRHYDLLPYAEGLAYMNGYLCHVGNYPRSVIYTYLEGPQYGLQTVVTYSGVLLYVNYDFEIEYTPYGVILHHYYDDSQIITGSNQLISFY